MSADVAAKLSYLDVFGMNCISIECGAITKDSYETGVVRTRKLKNVASDGQTYDLWYDRTQTTKQTYVLLANFASDFFSILPNNNVGQHNYFIHASSIDPQITQITQTKRQSNKVFTHSIRKLSRTMTPFIILCVICVICG